MKMLPAFFAAAALSVVAAPASAAVLVADTGWQYGEITEPNALSGGSPFTFTLSGPGIFRLTDVMVAGDTYWLFEGFSIVAQSAFETKGSLGGFSFFDSPWTDSAFSKIETLLAPGSYAFTVVGDGAGGMPAGFGVRLDSLSSPVPEPGTWALAIVGFGMLGGAIRYNRRRTLALTPA